MVNSGNPPGNGLVPVLFDLANDIDIIRWAQFDASS